MNLDVTKLDWRSLASRDIDADTAWSVLQLVEFFFDDCGLSAPFERREDLDEYCDVDHETLACRIHVKPGKSSVLIVRHSPRGDDDRSRGIDSVEVSR